MKRIIITVVTIGAVMAVLGWSSEHDKKVEQASARYEKCVAEQYGTTPAAWYNKHNEYPECN